MIRLIDLPGVRDLESSAVLHNLSRGVDHAWRARIDQVSRALFGITEAEALLTEPEGDDFTNPDEWAAYDDLVDRLYRADLSEWDLTDDLGRPLLVANRFEPQIRAVVARVAGKMPDLEAAKREAAQARLEADRERFLAERRKARRNEA